MKKLFLLPFLLTCCITDPPLSKYQMFYDFVNKTDDDVIIKFYLNGCAMYVNRIKSNDTLKLEGIHGIACKKLQLSILDSVDFVFTDQKQVRMRNIEGRQKWGAYNIFNLKNYSLVDDKHLKKMIINLWYTFHIDTRLQKLAQS